MPVYEYRCQSCGKRFQALIGMTAEPDDEACPHCGSKETARLVSRFIRGRSEDARVDEIADRLETMGEPESPAEMRALAKEMGRAMDDDMSEDLEAMFEADMEGNLDDED